MSWASIFLIFFVAVKLHTGGEAIRSLWPIPVNDSCLLECSDVPKFKNILLSIGTSQKGVSIVVEIDGISADVRTIDTADWAFLSDVIKLYGVVPTSRGDSVITHRIKFNAKYSI